MLNRCSELKYACCLPFQKHSHICLAAVRQGEFWCSCYTHIYLFIWKSAVLFASCLFPTSCALPWISCWWQGVCLCREGEMLHLQICNQLAFRAIGLNGNCVKSLVTPRLFLQMQFKDKISTPPPQVGQLWSSGFFWGGGLNYSVPLQEHMVPIES